MADLVSSESLDDSFLPGEDGLPPPDADEVHAKSDDGLYVRFFRKAVPNLVASWGRTYTVEEDGKMVEKKEKGAGRLIVEEVDWIQVHSPADPTVKIDTIVSDKHKRRFPKLWRSYQRQQDEAKRAGLANDSMGTPLAVLPGILASQVEELKYLRVTTVEQLAAQPDSGLRGVVAFVALRDKAQAFLKASESAAPIATMQAQMDAMAKQNAALQAQMAEMAAKLSEKPEAVKPKK